MTIRVQLPGGTLKIKRLTELRRLERDHKVPVVKIGSRYFIWWPRGMELRQ